MPNVIRNMVDKEIICKELGITGKVYDTLFNRLCDVYFEDTHFMSREELQNHMKEELKKI